MILNGKSIIGASSANECDQSFSAINPATSKELEPSFYAASKKEVEQAVELAADAFTTFSAMPGKVRADFIREIAKNISDVTSDIVERATQETGLPEARIQGETLRTTSQLQLFADLIEEGSWVNARIEKGDPDRKPLPKPDLRSYEKGLGPVVIFGASNFPLAFSVAGGDTAAAFAAGCPVIVKAHSAHPGTSEIVGKAIQKAVKDSGLPEGVFSMIFGSGSVIGEQLVKHEKICAVGFTGSRKVGRHLMDIAAAREVPIPVYAEMSSINPVIFLQESLSENGEALAASLKDSVTLGVGQFCTNPGLVLVEKSDATTKFIKSVQSQFEKANAGTMLTPNIAKAYSTSIEKHSKVSSISGFGNETENTVSCSGQAAYFITNGDTFLKENQLKAEVFGPSTTIVEVDNKDQMKEILCSMEGQLTGTIHGTDADLEANKDITQLLLNKVGRLIFNGFPTGVEVCSSIIHGGPYPATSDGRSTSVGSLAIHRFTRTVCYQNSPEALLPDELKDSNPLAITRLINRQIVTSN